MARGGGAERAAMWQVHYEANVFWEGVAPSSAPFVVMQTNVDPATRAAWNPTPRRHQHYLPVYELRLAILRDPLQIIDPRSRARAYRISPDLSTRRHYTDRPASRSLLSDIALR